MVSAGACEIRWCFETRCRYFAKRLLAETRVLSLSPFSFRNKGNEGERSFPPRRSAAVVIFHWRGVKKFQCTAELGEFGRVTAPRLSHMFQSFKLNRDMNRCLGEAFCSPAGYVTACARLFSSYWHFKIRRSGAGPLPFFFFSSFFKKKRRSLQWTPFVLRRGKIHSFASSTGKSGNQPRRFHSGRFCYLSAS